MSNALSPAVAAALRQTAEGPPRLGAGGVSSPGAVAGQFAAMLASLRDGGAEGADQAAATGVSQPFGSVSGSANGAQTGEHRVYLSAVSLLTQDVTSDQGRTEAQEAQEPQSSRRGAGPADVSLEVLATSVASGAPADGRWMATLMAAGQPTLTADVAA